MRGAQPPKPSGEAQEREGTIIAVGRWLSFRTNKGGIAFHKRLVHARDGPSQGCGPSVPCSMLEILLALLLVLVCV